MFEGRRVIVVVPAAPAITLRTYAHLFDKAKYADETRERLAAGFGHLLAASS